MLVANLLLYTVVAIVMLVFFAGVCASVWTLVQMVRSVRADEP